VPNGYDILNVKNASCDDVASKTFLPSWFQINQFLSKILNK